AAGYADHRDAVGRTHRCALAAGHLRPGTCAGGACRCLVRRRQRFRRPLLERRDHPRLDLGRNRDRAGVAAGFRLFPPSTAAAAASRPGLSMVAAARPDVQIATHSPQVTLDISNLLPWVYRSGAYTGDLLMVAGSQANAFGRPHSVGRAAAATTWHGTFDWNL